MWISKTLRLGVRYMDSWGGDINGVDCLPPETERGEVPWYVWVVDELDCVCEANHACYAGTEGWRSLSKCDQGSRRAVCWSLQESNREDEGQPWFLVSLHLQLPNASQRQDQDKDVGAKPPYSGDIWGDLLILAVTRYSWVVGELHRGTEEDGVEEEGGVEHYVGCNAASDEPLDGDVIVDCENTAEE